FRPLPRFPHGPTKQGRTVLSGRLQIWNGFRGCADRVLIVRRNCLCNGEERRLITKVISPGADLLLDLAAMHLPFFHVDPKRSEECNRKPEKKNQRREDQPTSPFVS